MKKVTTGIAQTKHNIEGQRNTRPPNQPHSAQNNSSEEDTQEKMGYEKQKQNKNKQQANKVSFA